MNKNEYIIKINKKYFNQSSRMHIHNSNNNTLFNFQTSISHTNTRKFPFDS